MILNLTKNIRIGEGVILSDIIGKAKGLMFCNRVENPLIFAFGKETYINLHMVFVFCAIDVILLDSNKTVVETRESLKPFHFFSSRKKARYVIEAEEGTIRKTGTEKGDKIKF
ncbi:DUF192 domain-containing protein [Candidatus Woesearchaeota archaeon]|nr:DUF192 domain-containing protein [Candidatus Woesearchaeota archaeon]